jgi:hypothetical protein
VPLALYGLRRGEIARLRWANVSRRTLPLPDDVIEVLKATRLARGDRWRGWLGHAGAAFTMATYGHSQEDALRGRGGQFCQGCDKR